MKPFTSIAVVVLALVALFQLGRVVAGWEVSIAGAIVPPWASVVASIVAAGLAAMVAREARR